MQTQTEPTTDKFTPAPVVEAPTVDLSKRTVLLNIEFHAFGNSKKLQSSQIAVQQTVAGLAVIDEQVKKSRIRASKALLESPELDAINQFDGRVKRHLDSVCLPYDVALRVVPFVKLREIDDELKGFGQERKALVQAFLDSYPKRCETASTDLSSVHRLEDYPPVEDLARRFGFSWKWVSFAVPEQLKGICTEVWEQERSKAAQRMAEASSQIQLVLRETLLELVKHMGDRLKEDESGKPVTFHKTTVSKLAEFLGNFDFRNVTDDGELQAVVSQTKALLQGVDVEQLKTLGTIRTQMKSGVAALAAQLDGLVVNASGRKFRFDEE
jgi:hypothetical protein